MIRNAESEVALATAIGATCPDTDLSRVAVAVPRAIRPAVGAHVGTHRLTSAAVTERGRAETELPAPIDRRIGTNVGVGRTTAGLTVRASRLGNRANLATSAAGRCTGDSVRARLARPAYAAGVGTAAVAG